VRKHWDRDTSILYYDVTNYYFEIDAEDSLRRRGVSKEHRPNPIVQMGLFMDASGLPLSCDLYAGNANDCLTLLPSLKRWKDRLKYNKIIVVADRGLNTSDNTLACQASGNGYIFGQTVRGGDKDLKSYALDQQGYRSYQDKSRLKSRIIPRIVSYTDTDGREQKIDIDQKQVIFYSPEYDRRAKYEREKVAEKALDLIANPGKYTRATSVGAAQYVKGLAFNKTTGEVAEGRHLVLDEEKLKSQARFDGYYSIVTSELDMSDAEIVGAYRGLWEIEESFRITKSDLAARPVYLSRPDHIEAHFLICFLAITLLRLLERELDEKYPPARIIKSLKKMTGSYLKENYWLFDYTDDIIGECERAFGLNLSRRILSLKEIRALIGKSKKS
jgi:hypothetical protein